MNKKIKVVILVIIVVVLIIFAGYIIYNELKPSQVSGTDVIKNYISIYFKGSRMIFPLNLFTNSTG